VVHLNILSLLTSHSLILLLPHHLPRRDLLRLRGFLNQSLTRHLLPLLPRLGLLRLGLLRLGLLRLRVMLRS
jgi:hypothetical protein